MLGVCYRANDRNVCVHGPYDTGRMGDNIIAMKEKKRTSLQYDCMEMQKYKKRRNDSNTAFLRVPYQYTSAEVKDDTQTKLHEFDYLK